MRKPDLNGKSGNGFLHSMRISILLLALVLTGGWFSPALTVLADPEEETAVDTSAEQEKIKKAQEQIDELHRQQQETENQISGIQAEKNAVEGQLSSTQGSISSMQGIQSALTEEMGEVGESIVQSIASIEILEEQIADLQGAIEVKQQEYDEAKHQEEVQYEAMKNRVRFMYEKGEIGYMDLLTKASSFGDMLNKADYVEKLYEYDRNMLFAFQETQRVVAEIQEELEDEKAELEESQRGLESEKAELEEKLAALEEEYDDYEDKIAAAQAEASALRARVTQQAAQISALQQENANRAALERQLSAEKAAAEAAAAAKVNGTPAPTQATAGVSAGLDLSNAASVAKAKTSQSSGGSKSYAAPGAPTGANVVAYASQFVGNPYVYGGTSLTNGTDCSGFTMSVYAAFGYSLPRTDASQRGAGIAVDSLENAVAGDIICYAGHVGIYCGDGTIVHASTPRSGIKYTQVNYRPILAIRRIIY
ncbi:MAG: C40 family peptidase [Lachnospiraceae bacterium]|nr:C40 family peptidase [Lachnospiraceae bacterium]